MVLLFARRLSRHVKSRIDCAYHPLDVFVGSDCRYANQCLCSFRPFQYAFDPVRFHRGFDHQSLDETRVRVFVLSENGCPLLVYVMYNLVIGCQIVQALRQLVLEDLDVLRVFEGNVRVVRAWFGGRDRCELRIRFLRSVSISDYKLIRLC